jgi:hypothetical protein
MEAVMVMRSADGYSIVTFTSATSRTEHDVMIMKIAARAASRHGAPPTVALEDRIAMLGSVEPKCPDVLEQAQQSHPARLAGRAARVNRRTEKTRHRHRSSEPDLGI